MYLGRSGGTAQSAPVGRTQHLFPVNNVVILIINRDRMRRGVLKDLDFASGTFIDVK